MYDMLGNQYFLSRQYKFAAEALEKALKNDPHNKGIQRKLIICHCQIGQVQNAIEYFLSLIKEDVDFIINTDPIEDDCPCPGLVYDMETKFSNNEESLDFNLIIGMYWLYCNLEKSVQYFRKAQAIDPTNQYIKAILVFLTARLEKTN